MKYVQGRGCYKPLMHYHSFCQVYADTLKLVGDMLMHLRVTWTVFMLVKSSWRFPRLQGIEQVHI